MMHAPLTTYSDTRSADQRASTVKPSKTVQALLHRALSARSAGIGIGVSRTEVSAMLRHVQRAEKDDLYRYAVEKQFGGALDTLSILMEHDKVGLAEPDQEHDGLAWLWTNRKKLGLGRREIGVLLNNPTFTLSEFRVEHAGSHATAAPVWKVRAQGNALTTPSFCYIAWPWQTGLKPTLVQ